MEKGNIVILFANQYLRWCCLQTNEQLNRHYIQLLSFGYIYGILITLSVKKRSFTATYITKSISLHCVHASGLYSIFYPTITWEQIQKEEKTTCQEFKGESRLSEVKKAKCYNFWIQQPLTFNNHHSQHRIIQRGYLFGNVWKKTSCFSRKQLTLQIHWRKGDKCKLSFK